MSSSNSTTNAPLENSITLEGLLHMQSVTNQLIVAFLACTVWELIITVDQDIELFWKQRWNISKFMFYFNRFDSILIMASHTIQYLTLSPSGRLCTYIVWIQVGANASLIAVIDYALLSRVYALWNLSRRVLVVCLCAFILHTTSYLVFTAYVLSLSSATGSTPPFRGCNLVTSFSGTYGCFLISIAFETVVLFLIVIKSYPIVRLRGVKAPLYSLLFEDDLAFYCVMLVAQIFALAAMFSPSLATVPMLVSGPSFFVMGVACNRLLLRLQRLLLDRGSGFSNSYTSRGVTNAADITIEFRNRHDSTKDDLEVATTRKEEEIQTQAKTQRIETGGPPTQSLETHQEGRHRPTITFEA